MTERLGDRLGPDRLLKLAILAYVRPVMRIVFGLALALVIAPAWTGVAGAKEDDASMDDSRKAAARNAWRDGNASFNLGQYEEAARQFEAAYKLVQDPVFLFNIAQSYRLAGKLDQALDRYRAFLRTSPEVSPNRAIAGKFVDELRRKLGDTTPPAPKAHMPETVPPPAPRSEAVPQPTSLYDQGKAYITLGKPVEAVAALQRYLDEGEKSIKPAQRAEMEREIARQKKRIATLDIRGLPDGASVTVDGEDVGKAPLSGLLRVAVGKHTVAATAAGHESGEVKIDVAGEDSKVVELKLQAQAAHPPPRPSCAENQMPIPGGTFLMGDKHLDDDSKPIHKVTLSAFCIDKTEVTVAAYRICLQSGSCSPPSPMVDWKGIDYRDKAKWSQFCTWGRSGLDQHPINCVDWNQASTYCEWAGGRLPTEAEWEYAARGTDDRNYPWGNEAPDATKLNACGGECAAMGLQRLGLTWDSMYADGDGWPATAPVGNYPRGASPFGVLDMAGNVWEWTADSYAPYGGGATTNPRRSGSSRLSHVLRGGSWGKHDLASIRTAFRSWEESGRRASDLGFRCASAASE